MKKFIFVLSILALSISLFSQTIEKDTIPLNEVFVVSTTKTQVNKDQVTATVSVVTRQDIEESGESAVLPVLTGRVPGLFVTERSTTGFGVSAGSAGTVNIRGVGSGNRVLMMFDGQPQWAGIFGHHLPDTYVTSDAEKVEVIRGPGSVLYGSNAMGGVINVITRQPHQEDGIHGQTRVQYGSYNTQKYMGNMGIRDGKLSLFTSLNHDRTDGHRDNSKFNITNGFAKLGYDFSSNWSATADLLVADFKSNNPGSITDLKIDNWVEALRATYSFAVENNYNKTSGAIKAFYNYGAHEVNDGWKNGKPRDYIFESRDHNAGVQVYQSVRLFGGNMLTAGFDFKNWGGKAWNRMNAGGDKAIIDTTINETAFYLLAQQTIAKVLTLNAGVRLEMNEEFGNEWVPQAGIAYQATANTTLKASLSKGFRSPNIREMYMYAVANPDLKPESMMNYDVSVLQQFLNGNLNVELTAFYIDGKDLIQFISEVSDKNTNIGSFINKGVELAANYRISNNLKLAATYSYLYTDKAILAAPRHLAFLEANWRVKNLMLSANAQYVNRLYTSVEKDINIEDYFLLNMRASYKFPRIVSVFVNGENLTATKYMINDGFPMPRATVMGGVDLRF